MTVSVQVIYAYEQDQITISDSGELDTILDQVAAEAPIDAPPLVALDMPDRERSMMVGLRGAVGVLNFVDFTGPVSAASRSDSTGVPTPAYFYCDSWTGLPADTEIPIEVVRQAAREFLATGERPSCVTWQLAGAGTGSA